jgi:hypothetical protein
MGFSPIVSAAPSQEKPFVVVELFSSEGCSSCPSADLLVSKLTAWARQNNEPVYPLIFHVDYWNNLGWRDVFSSQEFTQRQSEYARVFKDQQVYTPEMIVNGTDAFVGSDQEQLQKDINRELSGPASVVLRISLIKKNNQAIVKYDSQGFADGDVVNIALVERGLSTDVTAGENAGRRLHHDNVVREFRTRPLMQAESQITIPLNKVSDTSQASVIVYVQNPQTMLIEAAKQLDLEK